MKRFEYVIPVSYEETKEALNRHCSFLKRSQIEDIYFTEPGGGIVRLRKQDMVAKLSCTKRLTLEGLEESHETIILDFAECHRLIRTLGFREADRLRITRDAWRKNRYAIHLDRIEGMGPFLVIEAEATENELKMKRAAMKLLRSLKVKELEPDAVDNSLALPYTDPIAA